MQRDTSDVENDEKLEELAFREIHQILTEILNDISENNENGQGDECLRELENELGEGGESGEEKDGQKEEEGKETDERGKEEEQEQEGNEEKSERNKLGKNGAAEKEGDERENKKEQKYEEKEIDKERRGNEYKSDNEEEVKGEDLNASESTETTNPHKSNIKTEEEELHVEEEICENKEEEKFCIQNTGGRIFEESDENINLPCDTRFNVRVIEERINSVRIDWDLLEEAETYKIEKFHRRRGWEKVAWTGNGPTTIKNLDENFCYRLRIKAQRFCETHGLFEDYKMSPVFMVTTLPPLPTTLSLHRAIKKGQQFLVKRILRSRPSLLEYPGPNGYLPLANAIISDQHSVIDVLLSHGANVHIGNRLNLRTPLQLAFYYGRLAVARILLNRKAMLEATDINDMTACHFAVDANQLELLRFALENGANVNAIDACGWSLLSRAVVMRADVSIVKLLLTFGADAKSKDKLNKTCVDLAKIYKNTDAGDHFAKALK